MIFDQNVPFFAENLQFCNLIKYYCYKLKCSDLESHFWGFLWEVKYRLKPDFPDRYYAVCIRNEYIRLLHEKMKYIPSENVEISTDFKAIDVSIDISMAFEKLSSKQREVIRLFYLCGYTIEEIAKRKCVSRQAVNKCRKNALSKIGQILCG